MRPIRTLGCVLALAALVAVGARADENDRLTYLTFSGPVQLPGVTLAAGTYTFKMADLSGSRHVVHVFTKEDSPKLITTLMTIPNERLEPVKDTYIMFQERPAGSPQAMKAWFYPGRSIGEEFIYPKQQAIEIARLNRTSVLSSEGDTVGRVSSSGSFEKDSSSTSTARTTSQSTTTADATSTDRRRPAQTEVIPADTTSTTSKASASTASTASSANVSSTETETATTTTGRPAAATAPSVSAPANSVSSTETTTTAPAAVAEVAPAPAIIETPAPVAEAEVITAPVVQDVPAPVGTSGEIVRALPRTSSPLALFELISALSIAGGAGLRQLRKRA